MFANPKSFGLSVPSSGSLAISPTMSSDRSQGALTAEQIIQPDALEPERRTFPSFGSLALKYSSGLMATASAHTVISPLVVPFLIVEEVDAAVEQTGPEIPPISIVLDEIEVLTGLSKAHIASDLFNVSRTAYHDWSIGRRVSIENERRIRGTLEVLRRASAQYHSPDLTRGWLVTPLGSRAIAPIDMLKAGKVDETRLLALSATPSRQTALPEWLLTGSTDDWSERERKRRNFVVRESHAISTSVDED